jgi:hypothetical protein
MAISKQTSPQPVQKHEDSGFPKFMTSSIEVLFSKVLN